MGAVDFAPRVQRTAPGPPSPERGVLSEGAQWPLLSYPSPSATCARSRVKGKIFGQGQRSAAMAEAAEPEGGAAGPQGLSEGPALLAERPSELGDAGGQAKGEEASEGAAVAATAAVKEGEGTGQDRGRAGELAPGAGSEPGAETPGASGAQGELEEGEGAEAPQGGEVASRAEQVEEESSGRGSQGEAPGETHGEVGDPADPKVEKEAESGWEEPGSSAPGAPGASMEAEESAGGAPRTHGEPRDRGDHSPLSQVEVIEAAAEESTGCSPGELSGEPQGAALGAAEEGGSPVGEESEEAVPGEATADTGEDGDQGGPQDEMKEAEEERRECGPEGPGEEIAAEGGEGRPDGSADAEAIAQTGAAEPEAELSNHLAEEVSTEGAEETASVNGRGEDGEASEEGIPGQEHDITLFVKVNLTSHNSYDASSHP